MSEYDDKGKVSLWVNDNPNPKAPKYKGHAYAHRDIKAGEKVNVSLWENEPGERRPVFRGKLEDVRQRDAGEQRQESAPAKAPVAAGTDDPNDDIPFAWAYAVPFAGLIAAAAQHAQGVIA